MIGRHNLKQGLFIPFHLAFAALAYGLLWWVATAACDGLFDSFGPWLPNSVWHRREELVLGFGGAMAFAATVEGWKRWSAGLLELPGMLREVYGLSDPGPGSGSGRLDLSLWSMDFHLVLNLALSGPLQIFAAWQRIRNLVPDSVQSRSRVERCLRFARAQATWHPESLYAEDETAMRWLVLMGLLDHSPTKERVRIREMPTDCDRTVAKGGGPRRPA